MFSPPYLSRKTPSGNSRSMGFWLGDALAGFTPFGIGLAYYLSGNWKKQHLLRE